MSQTTQHPTIQSVFEAIYTARQLAADIDSVTMHSNGMIGVYPTCADDDCNTIRDADPGTLTSNLYNLLSDIRILVSQLETIKRQQDEGNTHLAHMLSTSSYSDQNAKKAAVTETVSALKERFR